MEQDVQKPCEATMLPESTMVGDLPPLGRLDRHLK
jgi:hypothetical protein